MLKRLCALSERMSGVEIRVVTFDNLAVEAAREAGDKAAIEKHEKQMEKQREKRSQRKQRKQRKQCKHRKQSEHNQLKRGAVQPHATSKVGRGAPPP